MHSGHLESMMPHQVREEAGPVILVPKVLCLFRSHLVQSSQPLGRGFDPLDILGRVPVLIRPSGARYISTHGQQAVGEVWRIPVDAQEEIDGSLLVGIDE